YGLLPRVLHCSPALHVRGLLERPSAQSPLARSRSYLLRHGVSHHVSGHYPTFIARTDSCASPQPSHCLGGTLGEWGYAGCRQPLRGGGPSRRCAAHLSLRAWTPTPAALEVHVPVSSPKTSAFPPFGPGRRSTKPVQRLQHGALFEAAVIPSCSGPQVCSPPRSLLPLQHTPY